MRTSEFEEVKKWLRGLRIGFKTFDCKIDFYNDLVDISERLKVKDKNLELDKMYYFEQIKYLEAEIKRRSELIEDCFEILNEIEQNIIVLKYMKGIGWDYISTHTYISKSHAVRVHNSAIKKISKNKALYTRITESREMNI